MFILCTNTYCTVVKHNNFDTQDPQLITHQVKNLQHLLNYIYILFFTHQFNSRYIPNKHIMRQRQIIIIETIKAHVHGALNKIIN